MARALEGSIRERPNGSWEVKVYSGRRDPSTGKPVYIYRTAVDQKRAERLRRKLVGDVLAGAQVDKATISLAELVEEWWAADPHLRPNTRANYRLNLDRHIIPALGRTRLDKLGPKTLADFLGMLQRPVSAGGKGLSAATARKVRTVLSAVLSAAVEWEYVSDNAAQKIRPPRGPKAKVVRPSMADIAAILRQAGRDGDEDFLDYLWLSADVGSRRGEALGVRWGAIDWEHQVVLLAETVIIGEHGVEAKESTKTDEDRWVSLSSFTMERLAGRRVRLLAELARVDVVDLPAAGYVFSADPFGRSPWRPDSTSRKFRLLKDRAGVQPGVTLHGLRHAMVSELQTLGTDLRTLTGRAGHSAATALNTYSHRDADADRVAAEAWGGRLSAAVNATQPT